MTSGERYLDEFKIIITHFYQANEGAYTSINTSSAFIDGFIRAGIASQIVTSADIQEVIDVAHMIVFNQTRDERRKARALAGDDPKAWEVFDKPSFRRK